MTPGRPQISRPIQGHLPADIIRERLSLYRLYMAALRVAEEEEDEQEEQDSTKADLGGQAGDQLSANDMEAPLERLSI
jgi:hypothetical protein